jgi:hypothetical protein
MLHYHGTPITPRRVLESMCPNNFCVSFAEPRDADYCLKHGQSVMLDNGAYSAFTIGKTVDWHDYYRWVEDKAYHPHWAVVPDIIGGSVEDNRRIEKEWPFPKEVSAVVYHFGESHDRLREMLDSWPRIAIAGSVGSVSPGTEAWEREIDAIWDTINRHGAKPWVHMMRAHSAVSSGRWPFASADSATWARNHSLYGESKWERLHWINRLNPSPAKNMSMELFGDL